MTIDATASAVPVGFADQEHAEELRARLTRVERVLPGWDVRDVYLQRGVGAAPPQPMLTRGDLSGCGTRCAPRRSPSCAASAPSP